MEPPPPVAQKENTYDAIKEAANRTGDAAQEWIKGPGSGNEPSPAMRPVDPDGVFESAKRAMDDAASDEPFE